MKKSNLILQSNQKAIEKIWRTAIYIRLSREDGDKEESSSVTNQRDIIKRFIEENESLVMTEEYVDDGWTGTNFDRPAFQRMLKDIEKGIIDAVITKDLSRLGRDYIDTGYYIQRFFPENNIRYIAILDNIDTLEDAGMNDIAPFKSVINDFYVKDISKKIRSALVERKKAGKFLGATAPYGYQKDSNNKFHLIINEEEAKVVRYIFDLYLQGNGLTKISQILTKEGIPVPGESRDIGKTRQTKLYSCWKQTTVSRILRNQVYIGNLEQFKRRKINYKSKIRVTVPKEQRYVCENTHDPIIDKNKFEQVQEIIEKNASFKSGTKHDYLFKGLLYCADCGARLYLTYSNYALKKYGEYRYTTVCYTYSKLFNQCSRHSNSIPILESLLINNIKKVCSLYINKNLKEELIKIAEGEKEKENSKDSYKKQIELIDKKIEDTTLYIKNLYMDKVKGIINEREFVELSKSFEGERQNYIKQKESFIKLCNKIETKKNDYDKIEKLAKEFISLEKPNKELLQQLIEKITISEENEVTIYFKFKELNDLSILNENKMEQCRTVNKRNKKAS